MLLKSTEKKIDLVFIGMPGSGKGTQAKILADTKNFNHVSTGDLLRKEIGKDSQLGKDVKEVIASGALVSDELVLELLKTNTDYSVFNYIYDGFPRNVTQAKAFSKYHELKPFNVIYFKLDGRKVVERLSNRRMTPDGKYIYNLISSPPKVRGKCDITGVDLIQRSDDREEVVRKRVEIFEIETSPLISFYSESKNFHEIDAELAVNSVTREILKITEMTH
ncbi:MAG: nucleoside monophosphate kinase [Bacteriovoracaceae bacterium]|nr:nucleoside monophosphate kinase [Bacteriovoracaceae bacterium]